MPTKAQEFEYELACLIRHYGGTIEVSNAPINQPAEVAFPDGSTFLITDSVLEDYDAN